MSDVPYYVYIVRCNDGTYYVGSAHHVAERLSRHNAGRAATYTAMRRPVTLIYAEEHPDQLTAIRREKQLKGWSHQKRDALVHGDMATLRQLSKSRT
ncbi:MAG TPA: GIY-YIG nuclease family protein [Armatimonadota bacterium]